MSPDGLRPVVRLLLVILASALGGCAQLPTWLCGKPAVVPALPQPVPVIASPAPGADLLAYRRELRRLSSQELELERNLLAAEPLLPEARVRLAMVIDLLGGEAVADRALAMLEPVLSTTTPEAMSLQPLASLLADQYEENRRHAQSLGRLNQEVARLGSQARSSQMRAESLQQKLDDLLDIEHGLPSPAAGQGRRR